MKRSLLLLLGLSLLNGLTMAELSAAEPAFTARVIKVVDGDTLWVQKGKQTQRIRLAGIDAPELRQKYGEHARQALSELCLDQSAHIQPRTMGRRHPLPNLTLAAVRCHGQDVGLSQLRHGMAWWSRQQARFQPAAEAQAFEIAESKAQFESLGLWGDESPLAPWEWRSQHPEAAKTPAKPGKNLKAKSKTKKRPQS